MARAGTTADAFCISEVRGVAPAPDAENEKKLRWELARCGVICLPMDRALEDSELQQVARLFGAIKDPVAVTKEGQEFRYSEARQIIDTGFVMTDEIREKLGSVHFGGLDDERPGLFETYHCDDTYTREPAGATVLHARALPESGGGPTCFLDMRGAYQQLDPQTQEQISKLRVVYAYNNENAFPPRRAATGPADVLEEVIHPLVRTHAIAGTRALFLDLDRAKHIEGMEIRAGRRFLQELQDHAEAHAPRCEHSWRDHDVLVWDNASVQHKAAGDFAVGEARRFWRYMIAGEAPA